ncbi:MAG: hypothetical protein LBW85_12330 [Deltaproteobacteria bacterium]|jgi:hypothetical protein|nr:hypothetical protein [Deltaproteobacteria bacterium]
MMTSKYNDQQLEFLRKATIYVWWENSSKAFNDINRILTQVLNFGTFEDLKLMFALFSKSELTEVLDKAEAGYFNQRSWNFWNIYIRGCSLNDIPPIPKRNFFNDK